jgi:phosphoglycolate phosphatase
VVRLPQCVLFDLDGTLLDSIPGIEFSVRAAFAAAGLDDRELELRRWIGPPIRTILSKVAGTEDRVLLDTLEGAFRASYDSDGWRKTPCFPGVAEVLAAMKGASHRLFVISNKPRHVSLKILQMQGIAAFFEQVCTRDSTEPPYASKAGMLEAILSDHRLKAEDCVMVGDTMEDASAAALHKIGFIFMEHGYGSLDQALPVLLRLGKFSEFMPYVAMENVR